MRVWVKGINGLNREMADITNLTVLNTAIESA